MPSTTTDMVVEPPLSWRSYLVPGALLLASLLLVGWLDFRPTPSQPVLVIFSPLRAHSYPLVAAVAAGGRIIGAGAFRNSIVVQSDAPEFFARLHEAGAWFIADAVGRAGCGSHTRHLQ